MKISELFVRELGFITNEHLRNIATMVLDSSPECIATIPASSSGKYHPSADLIVGSVDENGNITEGGLVKHIKAVVGVARCFMDSNVFRDMVLGIHADIETLEIYQDVAITACLLHDCMKPDNTPKHSTKFDHPLLAAELFNKCAREYYEQKKGEVSTPYIRIVVPLVKDCIASHMGKWKTAPYAKGIVLPEPKTGIENFVHMCDYIASRNFFDFNFDKFNSGKW